MNKMYFANMLYVLFMLSNIIEIKPCQSLISCSLISGISGYVFGTFLQNTIRYRQDWQVNECKLRCLHSPENTEKDFEQYKEIEHIFNDKDALNSYYRSHYYRYILKDIKDKNSTLKNWNHSIQNADVKIKNFINRN